MINKDLNIKLDAKLINRHIEDELKDCYEKYSIGVITDRALPDIRDGCKPVQRRILYAMHKMSSYHNKPHKKCLRICGEVAGKYHPFGDATIYAALVRMIQDFNTRYPLIEGQGNFGSIDGDRAADARYTEARLSKLGYYMLSEVDEDTVDFSTNNDCTDSAPDILPARIPNLIINGTAGIAVGMATRIPPHNLNEVLMAVKALINNPEINTKDILEYIKGPDFPTGGNIYVDSYDHLKEIYEKGQGAFTVRACYIFKDDEIIFTDIPYQENKAEIVETIDRLALHKKITGIVRVQDESDKEGTRLCVKLSKYAVPEIVLNQLFTLTSLEKKFHMCCIVLSGNVPQIMPIKQMLNAFIDHRLHVIARKTKNILKKEEHKLLILQGLLIAILNADKIIEIIKNSDSTNVARQLLINSKFKDQENKDIFINTVQVNGILEMRLSRFTSLELAQIQKEIQISKIAIKSYTDTLASPISLRNTLIADIDELLQENNQKRNTNITLSIPNVTEHDLIMPEKLIISISNSGYLKSQSFSEYQTQNRGSVGKVSGSFKEKDSLEKSYICENRDKILMFSNLGKVYGILAYKIPKTERGSMGKPIINFLPLIKDEYITCMLPFGNTQNDQVFVMITKLGIVKKMPILSLKNLRNNGINAIILKPKDTLMNVVLAKTQDDIMLLSKKGKAVKFDITILRQLSRNSCGVKAIKLDSNDYVTCALLVNDNTNILTISEKGLGKITSSSQYRKTLRNTKGIKAMQLGENDLLVGALAVTEQSKILVITNQGNAVKLNAKDFRICNRVTKGVKVITLKNKDFIQSINESQE